jgi:hypothetical protein
MDKLSERTIASMDFVLEETCRIFPNGGDHERRKYIAEKLKRHALRGDSTLSVLRTRRYKPPVRMIKLTERREITPYKWVHPDEER